MKQVVKKIKFLVSTFSTSKINVFVDPGFSIVDACGCCWAACSAIASAR